MVSLACVAVALVLAATLANQATEPSKEQMHQQMSALQADIVALRVQLASNPHDPVARQQLEAKLAEYSGIQASLGGDEPANETTFVEPTVGPKEQILEDLAALEAEVVVLRQQIEEEPANSLARSDLDEVMADIAALSAELGGDMPALAGSVERVVAPAPDGCSLTNNTFSNTTPTPIVDVATVTSNILVAGAGPYLWDVDMTTFITHTFAADLDITLTSPAGTVVTISTDNGGSNDNVYNGTLWDDQANPAGQVPYAANNGLVTDHTYVNLVTATPLVVEEALGAFIGENPNGTWTITITDDLGGDFGTLSSWSLGVSTLPAPPTEATNSFSNNAPVAIPTGPAVVSSTIAAAGGGSTITRIVLTSRITHTFASDLDITVQSPSGTVVTLTTDNGGSNDNVYNGTIWDDRGGTLNPPGPATDNVYVNLVPETPLVAEEALAAFNGENPNGTWTLTVSDDLGGDGGSIDGWTLDITTGSCAGAGGPCACTPTVFTNTTPTAIPTGPAVVSSTLVVGGAPSYLYDLDLSTFITHTFNADLDFTLQSPAGTVVTISTDNGGSFDNVYNGTLWDDGADPDGQVPYVTNPGLVTDHPYVNLVVATPLVVEEALDAFRGENPNGTWTITISDDLGGDGGSLNSWSLSVCGLSAAPTETTTTFSNNTPTPILDVATVSSPIPVAGAGTQIGHVRVTTNITHTFNADLDFTVASPAGTVVTLSTDNGGSNDNVYAGTLWDDKADPDGQVPYTANNGLVTDQTYVNLVVATPLVAEEALGAFVDEDPTGAWTLTVSDDLGGDVGTINSWSIEVTTVTCGGVGGCTPGDCDDSNPCTDDECNTSTGQCEFTNDDTNDCSDADLCNDEACVAGECISTPVDCDDDDCCTIDSCDPDVGCVNEPNTAPPVITDQPSLAEDGTCAFLWPPQHGYVDFGVQDTGIVATDACGDVSFAFSSCTSSQPENDQADGNSVRDCVYEPSALHLRAERAGSCSPLGRAYESTITATNVCGVSVTSDPFGACVTHDRRAGPGEDATVFSANPGSNQNSERPGINGTYGTGCGEGCGDVCNPNEAGFDVGEQDWDGDGIPVAADNCPDVYNPGQQNGDSSPEGDDCDASDGVIDSVAFITRVKVGWAAEAGSINYNVYRGTFPSIDMNSATCFGVVNTLWAVDLDHPGSGQGYFYVITSMIGGHEGSAGEGGGGPRPINVSCP